MCGSQEKLVGSVLSLPLVGLNSDHQACTIKQQAPFSAVPSHQHLTRASHQRTLKPGSTATVGVDDVDDDRSDCFYFRMTTLGYRVKHSETQLTYKDLSWLKGRNGLKK